MVTMWDGKEDESSGIIQCSIFTMAKSSGTVL